MTEHASLEVSRLLYLGLCKIEPSIRVHADGKTELYEISIVPIHAASQVFVENKDKKVKDAEFA